MDIILILPDLPFIFGCAVIRSSYVDGVAADDDEMVGLVEVGVVG